MKWAFDLLGLPVDTDVPSVKRAYARLLRTTRPDENPAEFQKLHTAYQMVLAHASRQQAPPVAAHAGRADRVAPPATQATATAPVATTAESSPADVTAIPEIARVVRVSPTQLATQVVRFVVENDNPPAIFRWLENRPEFWSLSVKQQTGQAVLNQLFHHPQAISPDGMDTVLHFFDLDQVLSGIDPFAMQRLRMRQAMQWELLPQNHAALARRTRVLRNGRADLVRTRAYLQLLQRPFRWRDLVRMGRSRWHPRNIAQFMLNFCNQRIDDLPPQIDRGHVLFWCRASDRSRMTWPRFALGSVRALLVIVAVMALIAVTLGIPVIGDPTAPTLKSAQAAFLSSALVVTGSGLSLWLIYAGWLWIDQWQGSAESSPGRWRWAKWMVIPALCALSLGLDYLSDKPLAATCAMLPALVLAIRRYRRRAGSRSLPRTRFGSLQPALFFIGLVLVNAGRALSSNGLLDNVPIIAIGVAGAMGCWLADAWRHRTHLWPHAARA